MSGHESLGPVGWLGCQISGPRCDAGSFAGLECGREPASVPKVLMVIESSFGFFPVANVAVPGTARAIAGALEAVPIFKDETVDELVDVGSGARETFTVRVTPGAEGPDLQRHRTGCTDQPVGDPNPGLTVVGGDLHLKGHVSYGPPPLRHAIYQGEGDEMTVTGGVGNTARPFVCCQPHVPITDYQDRVESGEAEMAPTDRITGDDQQRRPASSKREPARAWGRAGKASYGAKH